MMRRGNDGSKFMLFLMIWAILFLIGFMFVAVVVSVVADFDIDTVVSAITSPWGTIAYQLAVFILPLAIWMGIRREPARLSFPAAKLDGKNIVILVALSFLLQPIMMLISGISGLFFNNDVAELMYAFQRHPFWLQLLAIAVTPAICEELVFRGYIQSKYRDQTIKKAALINGLFFAIMHLNLQQFAYTFVLGVIFAYMVHYTRSIWAGILPHFIVNGTQVTLGRIVFAVAPEYTGTPQYSGELIDALYGALPISPEVQGIIFLGVITLILSPVVFVLFREFIRHNKWQVEGDGGQLAGSPQAGGYGYDHEANINPMPDWANPQQEGAADDWVEPQQNAPATPEWPGQHQDTPATPGWPNPYNNPQATPPPHSPYDQPSRVDPFAIVVVVIFVLFVVLTLFG